MNKILIIQTAFLGDVVLATGLIEKLSKHFPEAELNFLLRKGNEQVLVNHPKITKLYILDKSKKFTSMWEIIRSIRKDKYDLVVNLQRFLSSGIIATFSKGKRIVGFKKNPMSAFFSESFDHIISSEGAHHEIERNQQLIESETDSEASKPKIYPSEEDFKLVEEYSVNKYITIAPASVWFTKQYPKHKWLEFIDSVNDEFIIYLLGAPSDAQLNDEIIESSNRANIINLAGKLKPLASAALMKNADMNYVNDSAPMHFASAVDAHVTAVYCSTVPEFGFGPLSTQSSVVQVREKLDCRPCGLHGHRECPEGHFKCAELIDKKELLNKLSGKLI